MLQNKKNVCINLFSKALVAESVDAADLKSVGIYPVPVQVWPSAPNKKSTSKGAFLLINIRYLKICILH